jgi:hypothetical protein
VVNFLLWEIFVFVQNVFVSCFILDGDLCVQDTLKVSDHRCVTSRLNNSCELFHVAVHTPEKVMELSHSHKLVPQHILRVSHALECVGFSLSLDVIGKLKLSSKVLADRSCWI